MIGDESATNQKLMLAVSPVKESILPIHLMDEWNISFTTNEPYGSLIRKGDNFIFTDLFGIVDEFEDFGSALDSIYDQLVNSVRH